MISGDEVGSDAYEYKEVDDIVYELDAAQIVITECVTLGRRGSQIACSEKFDC